MAPPTGIQQRPAFHANSSDEFPLRIPPPQRNVTPGPSGTRQTPTPPPSSPELQTNDRDLWASGPSYPSNLALSWASPLYPPGGYSYDPPAQMIPGPRTPAPRTIRPGTILLPPPTNYPLPSNSSSSAVTMKTSMPSNPLTPTQTSPNRSPVPQGPRPHLPARSLSPTAPETTCSISMAQTSSGTSSLQSTSFSSGLTEPPPGNYDSATLSNDTSSAERDISPWAGTSQSNEAIQSQPWEETQPSPPASSTTETELTTLLPPDTYYREDDQYETQEPSSGWSSPYLSWPLDRETRTPPNSEEFDNFYHDPETFRDYTPQNYTPFPYQPPDSPPYPNHPRRIQGYHAPQYGIYPMGGANDGAEGSNTNPPTDPPQPSNEERMQQARELLALKDRRLAELRLELAEQEAEWDTHADLHHLGSKGKQPSNPHVPNW
ncbi:uncharacterized protein ARMOST_07001 [Armillaria ostoyae]|uniref:Uncharacterized protein n=1 Tax=Armillaria ostoyae TaxID=47428 RepID=A0A284R4J8_ARMOS|nr:uncharacterized protein ARMOST_07001 [Armillaria ostoyae]